VKDWPKMQFRFYGISKWTGELEGDATATQDIDLWAKSRGVDTSGLNPFGERPTPQYIEQSFPQSPTYLPQEKVDTFFS